MCNVWRMMLEIRPNTVFIQIDAPGAETKFGEGATFKMEKTPIFMLT